MFTYIYKQCVWDDICNDKTSVFSCAVLELQLVTIEYYKKHIITELLPTAEYPTQESSNKIAITVRSVPSIFYFQLSFYFIFHYSITTSILMLQGGNEGGSWKI